MANTTSAIRENPEGFSLGAVERMIYMTKEELIKEAEALRSDAFQGRGMDKYETVSFMDELIKFLKGKKEEVDPLAEAQ